MDDKELSEIGKDIAKKKPRGGNSPVIGDNGMQVAPGDNSKYVGLTMELFKMPKIDLHDSEAVEVRLEEFFQLYYAADMKPTVVGMAMALGIDRRRLWEIKTGALVGGVTPIDLPTATLDSIKRAYNFMENLWEMYMQNGKINPVSGIFLGKNNFGYQDKTEMVLTPNQRNDSDYDADDIRKRYLTDSATIDSDSDSDS